MRHMDSTTNAGELQNEIEANLLASILDEEGIPHFIRSNHDSAYDGIFQVPLGWGRVEAKPEHHARITEILSDIRAGQG